MADSTRAPRGGSTALAALIHENRRVLELRLATASQLANVTGDIDGVGAVRGFLRDWHVIAIEDHLRSATSLHVVGTHDMRSWITSDLLVLNPDRSLVRTRNSIYGLGLAAETDLSAAHLMTIVGALKAWGLVDRYGLGLIRFEDSEADPDA